MAKTFKPVCLVVIVALVLLLVGVMLPAGVAQAADTGLQSPTATAPIGFGWDQNTPGFTTYAYADDSNYARGENGEGQIYFNYGFSIPNGATIDGIEVSLDSWYSGLGTYGTFRVFLTWNWGSNMTDYKEVSLTASETRHVLGGPTDTWGHPWTASELSNANFQVRIYAYTDAMCFLDWIPVTVYYTPTLFEHYNTGDNGSGLPHGDFWEGQTFTAESNHSVFAVNLKLRRVGSPGEVTVSIRDTSSGLPTGGDLASGTIDGNTVTTGATGEWYPIDLSPTINVTSGTLYAIVVKCPTAYEYNFAYPRADLDSPTYADGNRVWSDNSGSSWTPDTNTDFMFEVYGETLFSVTGTTGEVNCDLLASTTIEAYMGAVLKGSTVSDGSGDYTLSLPETGDYDIVASKAGYKDETQAISVSDTHTLDFMGETGLIPNAPDMSYVLACINHWLYPVSPCGLSMSKVLAVINAWLYPV